MRPRETFEGDQGRAADGRAVILEPPAEQLELLAIAELRDRPISDGAHAVVGVTGGGFELVGPLAAECRKLALQSLLGVLVRERRGLGEIHQALGSGRGPGPM